MALTSNGKQIGTVNLYDPFGGQLFSNTFNTVEDLIVSSEPHISLGIAQYGKRLYVAALGRFLQVDPVEGGTSNDYAYVNDPVNSNDFNGEWGWSNITNFVGSVVSGAVNFVAQAVNHVVSAVVNTVRAVAAAVNNYIVRPVTNFVRQTYQKAVLAANTAAEYARQKAAQLQQAINNASNAAAAAVKQITAILEYNSRLNALGQSNKIRWHGNDILNMLAEVGSRNLALITKYPVLALTPLVGQGIVLYSDCTSGQQENCMADTSVLSGTMAIAIGAAVAGYGIAEGSASAVLIRIFGSLTASQSDKLNKAFEKAPTVPNANAVVQNGTNVYNPSQIINSFRFNGSPSVEWLKHFAEGIKSPDGKVDGWHVLLQNASNRVVTNITLIPDKYGVFRANVTIDGVQKNAASTFFPAGTTVSGAARMVAESSFNIVKTGISGGRIITIGLSSEGIPIQTVKDIATNVYITAYPIAQSELQAALQAIP